MVQLNTLLRKTNSFQQNNKLPLLNSLFVDRFSELNPSSPDNSYKTFMKWIKRSPAMIGFLNLIATDMISDEVEFISIDKRNGRNRIMRAETFWYDNEGNAVAEESIYDFLGLGIGYNWIGKFSDKQLKELCVSSLKNSKSPLESKELEFKADDLVASIKKNSPEKVVKRLRHMAASSISINSNENETTGYVQRVGTNIRRYKTDEVLVFKYMPFDGKVYPLAPMESILSEVYLLWLITQNNVSFFENGGKPDNVFILPKEIAGSKNHEYLIETLKKYKKIQNKHGNMVFTGDLEIEKLMEVEHQMENKDLSLYLISVLAMFYGIPSSRIPLLIGQSSSSGDASGLADSGYWRKISVWQSKFEETYNRDLFIPYFGVKMKFRRGYLQDEVRETATEMQKTQIAEQKMNLGLWTAKTAGNYLKIDEEDIIEAQAEKKKRDEEIASGMLNQNLDNKGNVMREPDAKLKAKKKQTTQNNNQINNGGKNIGI